MSRNGAQKKIFDIANKHRLQTPLPTVDQSVGAILSSGHLPWKFRAIFPPRKSSCSLTFNRLTSVLSNFVRIPFNVGLTAIILMGRTKRAQTSSKPAGPKLKRPRRAKKRSKVKLSAVERYD